MCATSILAGVSGRVLAKQPKPGQTPVQALIRSAIGDRSPSQ